jgi:hypothetical protein
MNEPTIKARFWCEQCGMVDVHHQRDYAGTYQSDLHALHESYTHDDLVFAVALTIATLTGASKEASMEMAALAVNGLTGVKR